MKRFTLCILVLLILPSYIFAQTQTATRTLEAKVTDDGQPSSQITCTWTRTAGPALVTIATPTYPLTTVVATAANPLTVRTLVTFTTPGTYTFQMDCADSALPGLALHGIDTETVVIPPFNAAPTVVITSPVAGMTIPENNLTPINVTATNASTARLFIDGRQAVTASGPSNGYEFVYQWLTPVSPGNSRRTIRLRAEASNTDGVTASAESSVVVR